MRYFFQLNCTDSLEEYAEIAGNVDPVAYRIPTLNQNGSSMCFSTELTESFLAEQAELAARGSSLLQTYDRSVV